MPIVTEAGFSEAPARNFISPDLIDGAESAALDLPNDADAEALADQFARIDVIRIPFPNSGDGRGFSLARRLRDLGFRGRLRAHGHVISDQFRYALDCGFDEVEISDDLARRQPPEHWIGTLPPANYRDKLRGRRTPSYPTPKAAFAEQVTEVVHYTDRLFRFRIGRPASFRFRSGEFVMIGLPNAEKPVLRAYSIASPAWDDELEFYSIKVPGGPLTQHLQKIVPGDRVLMRKKPTGTLVLDALLPGRNLYMFATGTGIAPFASLVRDPETYEKFERVVLVHTCRAAAELEYGTELIMATRADPLVGEHATPDRLVHYTSVTREPFARAGRITDLLAGGRLFADLGLPAIDPALDRAMICGSVDMIRDVRARCEGFGLQEGANNAPGTYVVERAFVG